MTEPHIPEDILRWFNGEPILAERHGLPRIEPRWRVLEVLAVLGDAEHPHVTKGEWREFKTLRAAERYRDELARNGATALIQQGVTLWLDPDEWAAKNTGPEAGGAALTSEITGPEEGS